MLRPGPSQQFANYDIYIYITLAQCAAQLVNWTVWTEDWTVDTGYWNWK